MLNKLVIHLKNVIFVKGILIVVLIVLLLVMIAILRSNITTDLLLKQEMKENIQNNRLKLQSVQRFEQELNNGNYNYKKLFDYNISDCRHSIRNFIHNVKQLDTKYALFAPIKIIRINNIKIKNSLVENRHVNIRYDKITLKFHISDYPSLLNLSEELYEAMPCGSFILSYHIKSIEGLSPRMIDTLNTYRALDTIEVIITILLQNIIYTE